MKSLELDTLVCFWIDWRGMMWEFVFKCKENTRERGMKCDEPNLSTSELSKGTSAVWWPASLSWQAMVFVVFFRNSILNFTASLSVLTYK